VSKLSGKQQANIERMWELDARKTQIDIEMAAALSDLLAERARVQVKLDAIDEQIPESVQDTWDKEYSDHPTFPSHDERERWLLAYQVLKTATK
jgi:hypothetical protein